MEKSQRTHRSNVLSMHSSIDTFLADVDKVFSWQILGITWLQRYITIDMINELTFLESSVKQYTIHTFVYPLANLVSLRHPIPTLSFHFISHDRLVSINNIIGE
jgi:hypothetical protein